MHEELIRRLNETKTMSIVGMCKNAGKTTMLNWLLTAGHLRGTLGLTSIGRDGESSPPMWSPAQKNRVSLSVRVH